eukprot:scaffold781_cov132-Cylindrotheca_fusiformis.AAC.13
MMISRQLVHVFFLALLTVIQAGGTPRIVGGRGAQPGEFPYYVSVGGDCGGTLIASGVVLTAAHCADDDSLVGNYALLGAFDAAGRVGKPVKAIVVEQFIHPDYDPSTQSHDYMLLLVEADADPVVDFTAITLNQDDMVPVTGQNLTVIGMGMRNEMDWGGADALRQVVVQKVSHQECNDEYDGRIEEDNMLCAGCARAEYAGVYSRISNAVDWIETVVCGCWRVSSASFCGNKIALRAAEYCPTSSPAFAPETECYDHEGYVDQYQNSCSWYESNDKSDCPAFGYIKGGNSFEGITPNQACVSAPPFLLAGS